MHIKDRGPVNSLVCPEDLDFTSKEYRWTPDLSLCADPQASVYQTQGTLRGGLGSTASRSVLNSLLILKRSFHLSVVDKHLIDLCITLSNLTKSACENGEFKVIEDSRNSVNINTFSEESFQTCAFDHILPLFAYVAPWEAQLEALRAITLSIKMDCGVTQIYQVTLSQHSFPKLATHGEVHMPSMYSGTRGWGIATGGHVSLVCLGIVCLKELKLLRLWNLFTHNAFTKQYLGDSNRFYLPSINSLQNRIYFLFISGFQFYILWYFMCVIYDYNTTNACIIYSWTYKYEIKVLLRGVCRKKETETVLEERHLGSGPIFGRWLQQ